MRAAHLAIVAVAVGLAGVATWQTERERQREDPQAVLQDVCAVCPANLVRYSDSILLETGIAWAEQPEAWRRKTLERLRLACGVSHAWQTFGAHYRDESGRLVPADSVAE